MKKCNKCYLNLPESNFHIRKDTKDGFNNFCKNCRKNENIEKLKYIYKKKNEIGGKCHKCGFDNILCLEFHHLYDKKCIINRLNKKTDIDNEINKCILLCSFCHHLETEHSKDRNYKVKRNYDLVKNIKIEIGKCIHCYREVCDDNTNAFHFDHLNNKFKNVSHLCKQGYSVSKIIFEINKCQLLCSNCHKLKTINQFNRLEYL